VCASVCVHVCVRVHLRKGGGEEVCGVGECWQSVVGDTMAGRVRAGARWGTWVCVKRAGAKCAYKTEPREHGFIAHYCKVD
jgi:hypothetical protein